jgi:hypothetical protein
MATTKYIVNNLSGQTIDGNISINGNLSVTGVTTGSLSTYKALLTQLGVQTGTSLGGFGGLNDGLIIGETYTILNYQSGDDFSNIADVQTGKIFNFGYTWTVPLITNTSFSGVTGETDGPGAGADFNVDIDLGGTGSVTIQNIGDDYDIGNTITILGTNVGGVTPDNDIIITVTEVTPLINSTGCIFIATGEVPTNWGNGSTLESSGNLVVTVLENNLGFDIEWVEEFFGPGVYFGYNSTTGPLYNTFNRHTTFVLGGGDPNPYIGPNLLQTFIGPITISEKDDAIVVAIFDIQIVESVPDSLYYFPIEIQIKQDTDTTPIVISGTVEASFPITFTSIALFCNGNYIQSLYGEGTVNDMAELITYLNSQPNISYLGVYSDPEDGFVNLEMPTNLVNQFCSSGTLTFEVFND